jgi:hypothetical protein
MAEARSGAPSTKPADLSVRNRDRRLLGCEAPRNNTLCVISALRIRPLGGAVAQEVRTRRHDRRLMRIQSSSQPLGTEDHARDDLGLDLRRQTQLSLQDIAQQLNPLLRGWIAYYGRYAPSVLSPLLRSVNQTLVAWAMRKFKRFKRHKVQARQFLQRLATECADPFVHWQIGMTGVFA